MPRPEAIFHKHALSLRRHNLAVLPVDKDKRPLVKGFNRWPSLPSVRTVMQLGSKFPEANIAILPGLSGVVVVDVDDATQAREAVRLFGPTPVRVLSSRGEHFYYRDFPGSGELPGNLRKIGLNVDFKVGNSIVIAPPSRHASGMVYRHDSGSDWSQIRYLPAPNLEQLRRLLGSNEPAARPRPVVPGERWIKLNEILCANAWSVDSTDELLDFARTQNESFLPPLTDAEVVRLTNDVWKARLEGRIQRYHRRTTGKGTDELLDLHRLASSGSEASEAFVLLTLFKAEHAARCRRGETFAISVRRMAETEVLPRWTEFAYRRARNLLLKAGFLLKVAEAVRGRRPAQYVLKRCRPT